MNKNSKYKICNNISNNDNNNDINKHGNDNNITIMGENYNGNFCTNIITSNIKHCINNIDATFNINTNQYKPNIHKPCNNNIKNYNKHNDNKHIIINNVNITGKDSNPNKLKSALGVGGGGGGL